MKKGDVLIVGLVSSLGREQYGQRPAILICDTKTDIIVVIPLTSNLGALRFPYTLTIFPDKENNLKETSIALIFQIRAIDRSRVVKVLGRISKNVEKKINSILKEMLDL
jgi:mRNA interferase MazF